MEIGRGRTRPMPRSPGISGDSGLPFWVGARRSRREEAVYHPWLRVSWCTESIQYTEQQLCGIGGDEIGEDELIRKKAAQQVRRANLYAPEFGYRNKWCDFALR